MMRYRVLRFPGFKAKAVTFSWDDGHYDDVRLVEMMNRYGLKGTFNISSARFAPEATPGPRHLTLEEAKAMYYPAGHEVAVHGLRHISPYQSAPSVMIREMLEDRIGLERQFDTLVFGAAFPDDGRCTPEMAELMGKMGFHYCRCLSYDESFSLPQNWLTIQPTSKHNSPRLFDLIDKFLALTPTENYISQRESKWCYIWGHSHELRGQNNWEIIDRIGEKLGGKEDIWYANNSEICEYVRAYKMLQFSADDSIVYNPTVFTIYLEIDKVNVTIEPGQTLHL